MSFKQFTPPHWLSLSLDRNKFICFFFYSVFLLFFLSPDSYLYDVYFRCDSAWFFTCGKAWMNGMVPYVDFADSKGPLLWLIYGIGYLLNSHSYVGVFWVSCVFYAVSFTFAYKISRLYLSRRASVIVLALLPAVLFYKFLHYDVRTEDFCNTFIFISLYSLCRILKGNTDKRQLFKCAFAVGASMTCCLLMKWNYFFMIGGMALVVLFVSIRKNTLSGLWGGIAGIATPAVPFLVYFLIQGNFGAFITEYFINVAIGTNDIFEHNLFGCARAYWKENFLLFIGVALFCYKHKGSWGILFSLSVFGGVLLPSPWPHYYKVLTPFGIFFLIVAVDFLERKLTLSKRKTVVLSFLCVIGSVGYNIQLGIIRHTCVFAYDTNRQAFYDVSQLMATVKKPKVMISGNEQGIGILADALPVCRYWALQSGATKSMIEERKNDLQKRKPDFYISTERSALVNFKTHEPTSAEMNRLGYVYCGHCVVEFWFGADVYCKKELYRKLPPVKLRTIDLLLKRDILCGNSETK